MTSSPIFIAGASGFLGWNLLQNTPKDQSLITQYHQTECHLEGLQAQAESVQINLASDTSFAKIETQDCSAMIYAAAYSDIKICLEHPKDSHFVNVELPLQLSQLCNTRNIPFVYYSTDLVFDGIAGNYDEQYTPSPLSLYGEQKAEAERKILDQNKKALVLRCPLMYGETSPSRPASLQMMLKQLQSESKVNLFTDEFRSPIRAKRVAEFTWKALGVKHGLYNVGGPQHLSRYDMGQQIAKVYNIDPEPIQAIHQKDLPQLGPRPANCTLNSQKAQSEGLTALPFENELKSIYQEQS